MCHATRCSDLKVHLYSWCQSFIQRQSSRSISSASGSGARIRSGELLKKARAGRCTLFALPGSDGSILSLSASVDASFCQGSLDTIVREAGSPWVGSRRNCT